MRGSEILMAYERFAEEYNFKASIEIIPSFDIEILAFIRGLATIKKDYFLEDILGYAKIIPEGFIDYTFPCTIKTNKLRYSMDLPCYMKLDNYKAIYDSIIIGKVRLEIDKIYNDELYGTLTLEKSIDSNYNNTKDNIPHANEIQCRLTIEKVNVSSDISSTLTYIKDTYTKEIYGSLTIEKIIVKDDEDIDTPTPIVDINTKTHSNEIYGSLTIEKNNIEENIEVSPIIDPITQTHTNEIYSTMKYTSSSIINDLPCYMKLDNYKAIYDPIIIGKVRLDKINVLDDTNKDEVYNNPNPIIDHINNIRSNEIIGSLRLNNYIDSNYTNTKDNIPYANEIQGSLTIEKDYNTVDISSSIKYLTDTYTKEIYGSLTIEKIIVKDDEDIDTPTPIVDINTKTHSNEIYGSLTIEKIIVKDDEDIDTPTPIIDPTTQTHSNEIYSTMKYTSSSIINDLPCYMKLDNYKAIYDPIIIGKVRLKLSRIYHDELYGTLTLEELIDSNYNNTKDNIPHANEIQCRLTIEKNNIEENIEVSPIVDPITQTHSNEIYGTLTLEPIYIEDYKTEFNPYVLRYTQHNEIIGRAKITAETIFHTILNGYASIQREDVTLNKLFGSINYIADQKIIDLYAKAYLEKTGDIQKDLQGYLTLEKQTLKDDFLDKYRVDNTIKDSSIIIGHAKILNHYKSIDIPCTIKTKNLNFIYSIFAKIRIPQERNIIIPCRITIDDSNTFKSNILLGSLTIAPRDKIETDLQSSLNYIPGICIDIDSHAFIDAIYTRREFDCKIDIIIPESLSIPCTIDIIDPIPPEPKPYPMILPNDYYPIPKDLYPIIEKDSKQVHITIDENHRNLALQHLSQTKPRYNYQESSNTIIPKGKIIIAVSPTWNYEPYVFKNSLITFLDRYYRKSDIAVVFGGNPRSDFDIVNLCLNYRIPKDNLCCVMADDTVRSQYYFVQKFIQTMIEFKKEEYPNILRVFMFINQPNWYYNDSFSALASYCKTYNISAVAISPGGEYCEICEVDKIIDDLNNGIEWERQHRNHRTEYINIHLEDNQDRLVY